MEQQLSLFIEENTLINTAHQQLLRLEFRSSRKKLQSYQRLYPCGKSVGREIAIAEFWIEKLGDAEWDAIAGDETEKRVELWLAFEDQFGYPWAENSLEQLLRERYFAALAKSLDAVWKGVPGKIGFIYLGAGRPDEAIRSLGELVMAEPENGMAYGYLGDAYLMKNELLRARRFYQMAFVLGPEEVDLKHLADTNVREHLKFLEDDERIDGQRLRWFPAIGRIEGLFDPLLFKNRNELKNWVRRYQSLLEEYEKGGQFGVVPTLFCHAMILSDNAVGSFAEIALADIRKKMKECHPSLFAAYMEGLQEERIVPDSQNR